ncbi:MAG TPA: hypothetical protein PLF11_06325 [Bacillota bacterium]|nr:hypothetical protein [Bacillota bacterium]
MKGTRQRSALCLCALLILISAGRPAIGSGSAARAEQAAPGAVSQIRDYETVFGVLAPDGQVISTTVVDWIRSPKGGPADIFDPGDLTDVANLRGPEVPHLGETGLTWVSDPAQLTDINYSGKSSRPLPMSIRVAYILNGVEVPPGQVPGSSGRLEIRLSLHNTTVRSQRLRYGASGSPGASSPLSADVCVPMIVQISSDVPLPSCRHIDAPGATTVLVGKDLKVNWMLFPAPDASVSLILEGDEMSPAGFDVSIIPSMPPLSQLDVVDQLRKFAAGAVALDSAVREAEKGAAQLAEGQHGLEMGVVALEDGLRDLARLADAHYRIARTMNDGLTGQVTQAPLQLAQLAEADLAVLTQIAEGVGSVVSMLPADLQGGNAGFAERIVSAVTEADAAAQTLSRALASQAQTVASAKSSSSDALAAAEALARANPSIAKSPEYAALSAALKKQDAAVNMLGAGGKVGFSQVPSLPQLSDTARGLASNTAKLKLGTNLVSGYLSQSDEMIAQAMQAVAALNAVVYGGEIEGNTIPGMGVLCEGLRQIGAGLDDVKRGTVLLAEGGSVDGAELPGMGRAVEGLAAASSGVGAIRGGCAELASGARQLSGGLARMRKEGTSQMATELGKGLAEAEKGQAVLAAMADRLAGYDSFIGKPDGALGEVRFLLKIKAAK